jgi:hypothetical protein
MRLNAWVSILVFLFAVGWCIWLGRHEPQQRRPGQHDASDATTAVGADGLP